jgi:periplasmic divalent cation tolerance protein
MGDGNPAAERKGKSFPMGQAKPRMGARDGFPGDGVKADRVVLILSTVPESDSSRIAGTLVSERLVACVNAAPVQSCYRWKGGICRDREELLIMKTREGLFPRVMNRLKELHPYELPEILSIPVGGGSAAYLEWVLGETTPGEPMG